MTNKPQADNVSKTYWSLLCRLGLPSVPHRRGPASQAALGARGRVHQSLDRSASSAGHQLGGLMRGNGISPPPPWEPGPPSQGGPGVLALHKAGNLQRSSPSGPACLGRSAAAVPWRRLSAGGETERRYELDRRALAVKAINTRRLGVQRLTRPSTFLMEYPVQETRKKPETKRRWRKAVTEFCRRHHERTLGHRRDLLSDPGKPTNLSEPLCLVYKMGITVK